MTIPPLPWKTFAKSFSVASTWKLELEANQLTVTIVTAETIATQPPKSGIASGNAPNTDQWPAASGAGLRDGNESGNKEQADTPRGKLERASGLTIADIATVSGHSPIATEALIRRLRQGHTQQREP